jgi:hypothetical protein
MSGLKAPIQAPNKNHKRLLKAVNFIAYIAFSNITNVSHKGGSGGGQPKRSFKASYTANTRVTEMRTKSD